MTHFLGGVMIEIEAHELRLGNLVETSVGVGTVFNILRSYIRCYVDNELEDVNVSYSDIKPIPLTEEWLLKFGFWIDGVTWFYSLDYDNNKDTFKVFLLPDESGYGVINVNGFGVCLKTVHQLQNLYFALTQKELEYED